jgi:hypothetical protein
MIDFKGAQFPKSVILHAVFFYVRFAVSYRDLEEVLGERGVTVDHATLNRWVVKYSPMIAARMQARKRPTATSWRVDETYIKVKGRWNYLYRAVDRTGQTLDFMLSERRQSGRASGHQCHPEMYRQRTYDRDPAGHISEQYPRTGPPFYQADHPPDDGVQSLSFGCRQYRWHRDRAHDPQGAGIVK